MPGSLALGPKGSAWGARWARHQQRGARWWRPTPRAQERNGLPAGLKSEWVRCSGYLPRKTRGEGSPPVLCRIAPMPKGDRVCWVRSDVFNQIADRWDLAFRESARIGAVYCCAWFAPGEGGPPFFTPPAFALKGGTTEGINGRPEPTVN